MAGVKSKKVLDLGEDLEPLFDYSRVQPNIICLDDDDYGHGDGDSSDGMAFFSLDGKKKKKEKKKNTHIVEGKREHVGDKKDEEDEDDWLLPPPPKPTVDAMTKRKLEDDPTIKELRLMKQELQSLAQSTKDSRAVEDSPVEIVQDFGQATAVESLKPPSDRFKVIISIQDKDGVKQFRVFMDDKLERIFTLYAKKVNVPSEKLTFCFDGEKISPSETPESLGMEDNDIIEVHAKSS
ncbi:hypothetical protein MLD38_006766 [Melastoma candidum]|uniref:Uncharacterized protein n=1 Tax=Melastoma candidum TaxID=119954 RepID=A0ACB9RNM2_9MYRT|nr:hypothetical protein MLD38_006766 [Melastoma candidum]